MRGCVLGSYTIEGASAGPFVTVLTVSGTVADGAQDELRRHLEAPELASRNVIVDLTEAVLSEPWPFPQLAGEAHRFGSNGEKLVVLSGSDPPLPGLRWFTSLDDAMVELLGELAKLGDWPPPGP